MLEFEHIVQVNDVNDARTIDLTREQLWEGLVLRARNPHKFVPGMHCHTSAEGENEFLRTIETGDSSFTEKVTLHPQQKIHTGTVAEINQIEAESTAEIEEPETGFLFVRFSYRRELEVSTDQVDIAEHLKSAYVQVDRDAIAMIRMLAVSEAFNQSIN